METGDREVSILSNFNLTTKIKRGRHESGDPFFIPSPAIFRKLLPSFHLIAETPYSSAFMGGRKGGRSGRKGC
jgi:hypothetical protein